MTREKVKAMLIRNLCLALLALGIIVPGTAHAVCTGGVEGQLEYETVENVYRYCDGTDWVKISAGGGGGATDIDGLSDAAKNTTDNNLFIAHEGGSVGANDDRNMGIGILALDALNNTTGTDNVAVGYAALSANTGGDSNVALGSRALQINTSGTYNVGIGHYSLYDNTTGGANVALGYAALANIATSGNNIGIGFQSGYYNTTGTSNTLMGYEAGFGDGAGSNYNYSVAIGYRAGYELLTGAQYNTFVGYSSGLNTTTGTNNVFMGANSGDSNTTGGSNTVLGYDAGSTNLNTESRNILIGNGVDSNDTDDYLNIGNAIYGDMGTTTAQSTSDAEIIIDGALVATNITAKSTLFLQDYGSGSHTGTTAYNLAVDSSGNVIEEDAYDPGTLQDITSVHANVTPYSDWQCRLDSMRQVYFKGVIRASATISAGTTIGTLPSDCTPVTVDIAYIGLTGSSASTANTKFFTMTTGGSFVASSGMTLGAFYPVTTITYVLN